VVVTSASIAGCMTEKGTTLTIISRMRCYARRGPNDSCVGLAEKSSGFRLQNNIFGRLDKRMPNHSTISRTRRCIDINTHREVFSRVVGPLAERGVLKGAAVG
jgi:hypothetical protein